MEAIIIDVEQEVLLEQLSVQLSDKPEATKPFDHTFEFIGARFDTSKIDNVRRRTSYHVLYLTKRKINKILRDKPRLFRLV